MGIYLPVWVIVAAPLAGGLTAGLLGRRLGRRGVGLLGCLSVAAAFVATVWVALDVGSVTDSLYTWFTIGPVSASVGLLFDPLSGLMALVVTGVGLLIHVYAAGYMGEDGYARFFCLMNLFVAAMLILVLADNLLFLYLGWEGVGVCSYLLIGFWYRDRENTAAGNKAFIVTRVGDVALVAGLFLLVWEMGSLDLLTIVERVDAVLAGGGTTVTLVAVLLLAGAIAKSAQVPLQVWLPDAMAGPTPVSALLHAATMVTAGVYLIARLHPVFLQAPRVLGAVATIGALTAFTAACSALAQTDIKRILAYSTISQIGFMFSALGVGAFVAAMFHFLTHAIFKALLFLTAGIVSHATGESDVTRMGGLRKVLPATAVLGAVGAGALAGLPLVTSGFYSKEAILTASLLSPLGGHPTLWLILTISAGLTALYAFRWFFLIFAGDRGPASRGSLHRPRALLVWPCVILAVGALGAGFLETPPALGGIHVLPDLLGPIFPDVQHAGPAPESVLTGIHGERIGAGAQILPRAGGGGTGQLELALLVIASAISLLGLLFAYQVWILRPGWSRRIAATRPARATRRMWRAGWYFDDIYRATVVRPFQSLVGGLRDEPVDALVDVGVVAARDAHRVLSATQSGRLRTYAALLVLGVVLLLSAWLWS